MKSRSGSAARTLRDHLTQAVNLDMHDWWTPTAAGYFDHVSKAKTLEAVQVFAPGEVNRLAKLKKAQIASEAERLAGGSGWLPLMLRMPEAAAGGEQAQVAADFDTESNGSEVEEPEERRAAA